MNPEERIAELEKQNAALRAELEKLRREVEKWRRGFQERPKRRSSSREGRAPRTAKKPGRKAGHPPAHRAAPEKIDAEQWHPTPAKCACGGEVEITDELTETLVVDVPPVNPVVTKHRTRVGCCAKCQRRVVARLPGAAANGTTVATVTLGPNAQALALSLRFELSAPLGRLGSFMGRWFGVPVSAGGLARMFGRLQSQSSSAVTKELTDIVRSSPVVGMDETSLRQNGAGGWCWIARTERVTLFRVELSRGRWVAESILGADFKGTLVTDFLSVYADQGTWKNAFCGSHIVREAKKIAEIEPCPATEEFRDRVRQFYLRGEEAQQSGEFYLRRGARIRLGHLLGSTDYIDFPEIVALQERMNHRYEGVVRFIDDPAIPWHNNHTEQEIRIVARHRGVTGGTRSAAGSATFAHWLSVIATRRKNRLELQPFVHAMWNARLAGAPSPSVFTN